MKAILKFYIIIGLFTFFVQSINAQQLTVNDATDEYEKQQYPAVVVLMEPSTDKVKDAWENYLKDKYKVKLRGKGMFSNSDVLRAEKVDFSAISSKKMDFYTKVVKENDLTKMSVFASLGYDIKIGQAQNPQEYYNMKNVVQNFLNDFLRDYYQAEVKTSEEKVVSLEKDQADYKKSMEDNEKKIEELRKENEDLVEKINKAQNDWSTATQDVVNNRQKMEIMLRQLAANSTNNNTIINNNNKQ